MQITLNASEVEGVIAAHIATVFPSVEPEEIIAVIINEDGTASIGIGEGVGHSDDTPPVVAEEKPVQRRRRRANPQEAKHRPVDPTPAEPETGEQVVEPVKEEAQPEVEAPTSTGGQNGNSTPEPEAQGEQVVEPTEALKEEATEQAEAAASQEVSEEAAVQEEVQEEAVEKPATTKPSLFANLAKR